MDKKSLSALETFATITADLNTIIKYHEHSSLYLNKSTEKQYSKSIKVYLVRIDKSSIHPAYRYTEIVDRTFPKPYNKTVYKKTFNTFHQNNILVLVWHMIELEWAILTEEFKETTDVNGNSSGRIDLSAEALAILESLDKLLWIKNECLITTEFAIKPKGNMVDECGKEKTKSLHPKIVLDQHEKSKLIDVMIKSRINELNSLHYTFLGFDFKFETITNTQVQSEIEKLKTPKTYEELLHRFKKRVCQTIWYYMWQEMKWKTPNVTLTEGQGEYIYTVLLMFNLITVDELLGHDSPRKKANYISTFFKTDDKSKKIKFPEIIFEEFNQ